jgi:superfamily II DNA or RNA helicase
LIDYGYNSIEIARFTGSLNAKERRQNDIESSHVIISNRQYLFKNMNKLPSFDILIADEAHTTTADSTKSFIESMKAKIKIGCSGTLPRN